MALYKTRESDCDLAPMLPVAVSGVNARESKEIWPMLGGERERGSYTFANGASEVKPGIENAVAPQ